MNETRTLTGEGGIGVGGGAVVAEEVGEMRPIAEGWADVAGIAVHAAVATRTITSATQIAEPGVRKETGSAGRSSIRQLYRPAGLEMSGWDP
jgi:hypothetical protein